MYIRKHLKTSNNSLLVTITKLCLKTKNATLHSSHIITRINNNSFNVTDGNISMGVDFDYIQRYFRCDPNMLIDNWSIS